MLEFGYFNVAIDAANNFAMADSARGGQILQPMTVQKWQRLSRRDLKFQWNSTNSLARTSLVFRTWEAWRISRIGHLALWIV